MVILDTKGWEDLNNRIVKLKDTGESKALNPGRLRYRRFGVSKILEN